MPNSKNALGLIYMNCNETLQGLWFTTLRKCAHFVSMCVEYVSSSSGQAHFCQLCQVVQFFWTFGSNLAVIPSPSSVDAVLFRQTHSSLWTLF